MSQVSQKSFRGSCLWTGQNTGLCPAEPTASMETQAQGGAVEIYTTRHPRENGEVERKVGRKKGIINK